MIEREEFYEAIRTVRADIQGVHDRLDMLNGRTRQAEQKIAVLENDIKRAREHKGWLVGGISASTAMALKYLLDRFTGR